MEKDLKILEENLRNLQTDQVDGKEQEMSNIDNLKKHVDEVGEKIRQLEGISNQNADVINTFTVNHITYNEKFDKVNYCHLNQSSCSKRFYVAFLNHQTWFKVLKFLNINGNQGTYNIM